MYPRVIAATGGLGRGAALRDLLLFLLAAALWTYAAIRAHTVSFTYDECFTFLEHVSKNVFYQAQFDQMGGNHHLLNVWLMWITYQFFGNDAFVLRLPSLVAFMLYLYAAIRICRRVSDPYLAVGGFLWLVLHPYLIDFFSLARGYALGNAFILLSLWQGMRYYQDGRRARALHLAVMFAGAAALSHIVLLNYLIAFTCAFGLMMLRGPWRDVPPKWRKLIFSGSISLLSILILLPNIIGLVQGGSLNFGCDELWQCTLRSLAEKLLYHLPYPYAPLSVLRTVLIIGMAIWLVSGVQFSRLVERDAAGPSVLGLLTLMLCLLSSVIQHFLWSVPLPATRTALYLLPIASFSIVTALFAWLRWSSIANAVILIGCAPLVVLFKDSFNFDHVVEWKAASELNSALDIITADHVPLSATRPAILIRTGFETEGGMRYHMRSKERFWMAHSPREGSVFFPADYYLVEYDAQHLVDTINWTRLFRSEVTGLALYRDERLKRSFGAVLHRSNFYGADHAAGRIACLEWVVPHSHSTGPVLIIGSLDIQQEDANNWAGLYLDVRRGGASVVSIDRPTHEQIGTFGQPTTTHVITPVLDGLLPGDTVRFTAWPCFPYPTLKIGKATLQVLR